MPYQILELTGKPYRPSNGTEGDMFKERFCAQCKHDDEDNPGLGCEEIAMYTFILNLDDRDYPPEWVHDEEGRPTCTKFERRDADG